MWKKIIIGFCALVGSFAVGLAYYNMNMNAASSYQVSANATVKLGEKGLFPDGTSGTINKGDKVYVGMDTANGNPMSFILLVKETYNTYKPILNTASSFLNGNGVYSLDTSVPGVTGWFAMENEAYSKDQIFSAYPSVTKVVPVSNGTNFFNMVRHLLTTETTSIASSTLANLYNAMPVKTKELLLSRNLDYLYQLYDRRSTNRGVGIQTEVHLDYAALYPQSFFVADHFMLLGKSNTGLITLTGGYGLNAKDLIFSEAYFVGNVVGPDSVNGKLRIFQIGSNGSLQNSMVNCTSSSCTTSTVMALRLSAELDLSNVVFASGMGSGSTFTKVKNSSPALGTYSNIYTATNNYDKLKLRLLDTSGNHSISFNDIKNRYNTSIDKINKTATVYFEADALAGSNNGEVNTVSALFFKDNTLAYYVPIDTANGSQQYALDLNGLDAGTYQIALVNESYNENDMGPAKSSALTSFHELIITEPLSNLSFTPRTDLEYGKNVNVGDTVGMISSQNGAGTVTYSIIADPAYPSEYQNVTLGSDGKTVIVNGNALHAGTYHFKIQAQDQNNDPDPALEINASITVSKTNLSVAFNDPSQTKKSIEQAQTGWSEPATATPNQGVKTIYSIISTQGNISTSDIAIDPDSGALSYSGNGAYGKITVQASADDDPLGGYDDYPSATATKEIVIYRAVDGSITPDAQSTDANIPTFSASDPNAKPNGTIATVKGTLGTPDNGTNGAITYSYEIKQVDDFGSFEVNATTGVIKSKVNLGVKEHHITLIVKDQWSEKEIPLTIKIEQANAEDLQFYENSTSNTVINTKTVNFTDTNVSVYATVKGSTNTNPVTYSLKAGEPSNVIEVNGSSGGITIKGAGTVIIEASKQGVSGQSDAKAELTFTVTAAAQNFIFTDSTLINELPKNGTNYAPYSEVYGKAKSFQLYTAGNPPGTNVTYQLKDTSPTDVISVDSDGTVHILNASLPIQSGSIIVEAISHDPNGNYEDKTIELPITITKASQTVSFADNPIYVASGSGSVTPIIKSQDISSNEGGVVINDTDTFIIVDPAISKTIAKTSDGKTITYNYDKDGGIDIPLHVIKQGNRNYEQAEADGILHILGPDESILIVSDVGEVEYGEHFTIRSLQDDSASSNVQYTFTVDDTTYITSPTMNGTMAEFDAIKITGNKKVTITITRTADSEKPLSVKKQISVVPKPIEITIEDKEKLKGEVNPSFTVQDFSSQLVSWNGIADVIQPNDIKLNTIAGQSSQAGNYPIKGDQAYLNKTYPNYSFTFKEGTLTIKEENIEDDWYHLEIDDGNNTAYSRNWTNQDVNIVSDHNEYIHLSLDQSTWKTQKVSVNKEGKNEIGFWMKKDSGAITSEKEETIRIDKKAPVVKSIKATDTNNKLQDIINKLSGGIFFKPGTRFDITTSDENGSLEVSGTQTIAYKIYQVDTASKTQTLLKEDTISVNNEQASITIDETRGTYQVCMIPKDQAGNEGKEECHEITLKKINVDGDEDDDPDFNDPDGDGCPDLNIVLGKDSDGFYIKLNVDKDHDGLPELNIDSDGDGIADINVDQDGDGKADLNIVKITKWNPSVCVNDQVEEYCTDPSLIPNINVDLDHDGRPDINIDLDQDGIPDIDIDSDGDGKADVNIDSDQDGTADERIVKLKEWKIDKQIFTYQGVKFQTMTDIKVEEKQQLSDKDIIIENKDGSTFSCEMELQVEDVSAYRKAEVKEQAKELIEEEQEVKIVYEIKLLKNGTEVTPEGTLKIRIPIPEGVKNAVLIRRKKEGGYEQIKARIEEGYFVYESEELGIVAIIADVETNESDVKGSYYPGADSGGALTGDTTNIAIYIAMGCVSLGLINLILFKKTKRKISVE